MDWGLPKESTKLFIFLAIIKRMSNSDDWQRFLSNLIERDLTYSFITFEDYDFPINWQAILSE
jgi:hypothetical protein